MSKTLNLANPKSYALRKDLEKIANQLGQHIETLKDLTTSKLEQVSTDYEEKTAELEKLEKELEETRRVKTLDLQLLIKEDKLTALNSLATELGFETILSEEYQNLLDENETLRESKEDAVNEAIERTQKAANAAKAIAVKTVEQKAEVEMAQLKAANVVLEEKVNWYERELDAVRVMLKDVQNNSVRIAEAGQKSINLTTDYRK